MYVRRDTYPRCASPTSPASPAAEARPTRRVVMFAIIALALMMMSIDSTIVATALDALQHDLGTTINWAGWTITAYSFGFVLMLPVTGKLSQQFGRRRVFLISVATFTAASLLCGLVDNIYLLIALRAVQAAGGAGFTPSATGLVVDYFGDERDRAVSLFGSIFPIGAMIGPIFGGLFVAYWSWRGIFLVNVPFGIAVIILALRHIPADPPRAKRAHRRPDISGMALLGVGLLSGMLAASYLGEGHAHVWSLAFLGLSGMALVALWTFFRHMHKSTHPFIAPHLIHGRGFGAVNLVNALIGGIPSGVIALIPLYATDRYGIGALGSGTLLIAQGFAAILLSVLGALLIRRTGYRMPLYVGGVIVAIGVALLALGPVGGIPPYAWLAGSAFLIGAGSGALNPASRNAGLQLAPDSSSTLAALRSMSMQVGSIITIAIATAVLAGSTDPGITQAWIYGVAAVLIVISLATVMHVPEHHGAW